MYLLKLSELKGNDMYPFRQANVQLWINILIKCQYYATGYPFIHVNNIANNRTKYISIDGGLNV